MNITSIAIYVVVAALVFYKVIYSQMRGTLVSTRSLTLMPLILIGLGLTSTVPVLGSASAGEIALLAADVVVLAGLGVVRSTSTKLSERQGTTFQKGSPLTIGLWVLTIAVRIGFVALGSALGIAGPLTSASIALTIGLSIGVQNVTTYLRIQQRGLPLAEGRRPALVK